MGEIAARWRSEGDIRTEGARPFGPGDCPGVGVGAEHGVALLEFAGGDETEAAATAGFKLDPYAEYLDRRMAEGLENCRVLMREIRRLGYEGSYTTVTDYVRPRRQRREPKAAVRFETRPREQAQVDWGSFTYVGQDGDRPFRKTYLRGNHLPASEKDYETQDD